MRISTFQMNIHLCIGVAFVVKFSISIGRSSLHFILVNGRSIGCLTNELIGTIVSSQIITCYSFSLALSKKEGEREREKQSSITFSLERVEDAEQSKITNFLQILSQFSNAYWKFPWINHGFFSRLSLTNFWNGVYTT